MKTRSKSAKKVKKSRKPSLTSPPQLTVKKFLQDAKSIFSLPVSSEHEKLHLDEYPFDLQLLSLSPLYRTSRQHYLDLGGVFTPKVCSTVRSLSAQDLFKDEIQFSPTASELSWFVANPHDVASPEKEMESLLRFNEISLFHEQNHRIIWRLLPPPPDELADLSRYLNFAESLVVALDLALGDEIGKKKSDTFERMKVLYRGAGKNRAVSHGPEVYRQYLLALVCATYYTLEFVNYEDILGIVDYILPMQKSVNKEAVSRALEISELFTRVTNPLWQERYSEQALVKLQKIHAENPEHALYLPEDPFDLHEEFHLARRVFDHYGL
jgi:hypothetical protein